jgi:hypothetical protein
MRRQGLEGISPRRFTPVTTLPGVETYHIPGLVEGRWNTGVLNAAWKGFVYLRAIAMTARAACWVGL